MKISNKLTIAALTVVIGLTACNNGTGTSSNQSPATSNPLQQYVNMLIYSNNTINNKNIQGAISNQQSFRLESSATLSTVQVAYYQNSTNCSSGMNNAVTLNGPATLAAGTYTSSDASNYSLCSKYPSGCAGLYTAVQGATSWSMQYTYHFSNGTSYQSDCMINPNNAVGKPAEFIANYFSGIAACTVGNSCGFSQAYQVPLGWSTQVGANGETYGNAISHDSSGNSYITGYTDVGVSGQVQTGTNDYFIAKYDSSGTLLWSRQVGASGGYTYGYGISHDNSGNSYITGSTTVGISGQTQTGGTDYFIAKYDSSGNLVWTRQVGANSGNTYAQGISSDSSGNSYIAGATTVGISGQTQTGGTDYFIAKYDSSGNLVWTRQVGANSGNTYGYAISSDGSGNSYISGSTDVGISGQTQTGGTDYFIAKYDNSGNLVWSHQVGASGGNAYSYGISSSTNGNSYIAGYTDKGLSGQSQIGINDYFIAKYDSSGNLVWTRQVGADSGNTYGYAISSDSSGNSYIAGSTDVGISGQTQTGTNDYFIAKYDSSGNLVWSHQVGASGGNAYSYGISSSTNGNSYIAGYTDKGLSGQSQIGINDYFIAKIPNQ